MLLKLGNILRLFQYGSMSMSQAQHPINNRGRGEIMLPQRSYVPHHRQNYFDQFNPEDPITFHKTTGGDGIALMDAMNENFDRLTGRDDPMFASYVGPAISLRLEVNFISTFYKRAADSTSMISSGRATSPGPSRSRRKIGGGTRSR